ncbi:HTTM domain-containing protein [Leucobacter allii]|uniref:HTTM domain-containing protein n=1 Tax=Leucobacter allii TaxID=2932247 RepID=UPI001FD0661D|nr:HTTM domain-containing protein [Leucobacter allii]UOR03032.1 HTTM domain-containing protein [Leucobacter allii]
MSADELRAERRARGPLGRLGAFLAAVAVSAWNAAMDGLGGAILWGERWLFDGKKALYGLAVTRMLFGAAMLGLLLANFGTRLYTFGSGSAWNGEMAEPRSDFPRIWVFSLFHAVAADDVWFTVCYVLLMGLAVLFILGWRFRIVLPVFFVGWVGFIEMNDMVGDQSDNMQRIALILLFFADPAARWSLDARRRARRGEWFPAGSSPAQLGTVLHNLSLVALVAQVCFVYVSGGLYKAQGEPWAGGWAVYDPLSTMRFGTWPALSELMTTWGPAVAIASWGSILLQIAFPLMLLTRPTRLVALAGILSFHIAIGVVMGLPWFSLTMIAIDAVFIRDRSWRRLAAGVRRRWRESGAPPSALPAAAGAE